MKRVLSLVLALCLVLTVLPAVFHPVEVKAAESWMWPTTKGATVTSQYGWRNKKMHNGIDIGGSHGKSPIYASKSGTVVASYSGCNCRSDYKSTSPYYNGKTCRHGKTLGNYVIIDHGNGVYTRYMHLYWKGIPVVGKKVSQGDIIGYMGSTGRSTGVHLHFEIKTEGKGVSNGTITGGSFVNVNKDSISYVYTPGASGGGSSGGSSGGTVQPTIHTHSYSYSNDSAHPHSEYKYCSCGDKEYTGKIKLVTSCKQCDPVGSVVLTRTAEKTKGKVTFYRNNVENATDYTLKIYHNGSFYNQYTMSSDEKTITGLPSGNYTATLYAKNSKTGEERSDSCDSFKIVETYTISYNANGGSNAPSSHEKLQDDNNFTLKTQAPTKAHYVFKGWARSKNATVAEYQPGDTYSRNTKVTLYAVWEPETYTIKFDANGGKGKIPDITITYGDAIRIPNSVIGDYSYLKGWSTSKTATTATYKIGMDYKFDANTTLYAVWGTSTWSGGASASLSGSGTEADPYLIQSESDLGYLANKVNGQTTAPKYEYYKLTNNINLAYNEWVPIGLYGNTNQYFYGSFDGNGFTISDLYITKENEKNVGLFGYVKDSEIKDLTVTGAIEGIIATEVICVGGIVGYGESVELADLTSKYFNISDITVGTSFNPKNGNVGTIVGKTSGGTLSHCDSIDCIISLKIGKFQAGMIAGTCDSRITDCRVESTEDGLFSTAASVGNCSIGGLCGTLTRTAEKCSVKAPYFSNNIMGGVTIGGLIGELIGEAKTCSVQFTDSQKNSITATGTIGGFVGNLGAMAKTSDCKFDGKTISGTANVGGLVGYAMAKKNKLHLTGCQVLTPSSLPQKEGYIATWYKDAEFNEPYDFSQSITQDFTLYAKWAEGENGYDVWDGTTKEPEYNPVTKTYFVTNGEELAWLANSGQTFSGDTIELVNDIYLNDVTTWRQWERPSARSYPRFGTFEGVFDGKNHTIYGIYSYRGSGEGSSSGLFYNNMGVIKNLMISDAYIGIGYYSSSNSNFATVAAKSSGLIENCHNVKNVYIAGEDNVGGIVGYVEDGTVSNCSNSTTVKVDGTCGDHTGGIVGWAEDSMITNCYHSGTVETASSGSMVGGICGMAQISTITNVYNTGSVGGGNSVGGIVGKIWGSNIAYCYNTLETSGYPIVGYIANSSVNSSLKYCYGTSSPLYEGGTQGTCTTSYVTTKTDSQMKNLTNLSGFSSSTWGSNSSINNGYPYLKSLENTYKTYTITVISDLDSASIKRAVINVEGKICGSAEHNSSVGGAIGYGAGNLQTLSENKNILVMADEVCSSTSGSDYYGYAGNIIGYNQNGRFSFDTSYYNSEMKTTSSTNTLNATGTARAKKTMNVSFYTNVMGLTPYTSLKNIKENEQAVWVLENGELPELYYNCLNDITISDDIENGTVTIDKSQAVDGEVVTVTATSNEGYVLNKVYVDGVEQDGTTFIVNGNDEVYATFSEEIAQYDVTLTADENATASLVNADSTQVQPQLLASGTNSKGAGTSLVAKDGEEIQVSAMADNDYTVDAIYVNGEEIAGDSFILEEDTKVKLEVSCISTDVKAVTYDATDVSDYFATVGGYVSGEGEGIARYVRYWSAEDTGIIYTTEIEEGAGEYTAEIFDLAPETTYYFQMTEQGEVKSFTTCVEPNDEHTGEEDGGYDEDDGSGTDPGSTPDPEPQPVPVAGVTLNLTELELEIGEAETLTATVLPADADNHAVSWSSSDSQVATVTEGRIEAVGVGTATITVTTVDGGRTASCEVTVTMQSLTDTTISADSGEYTFSIACEQAVTEEFLCVGIYSAKGVLLDMVIVETNGDRMYTATLLKNPNAKYAKIFLWDTLTGMSPLAGAEKVAITQ